MHPALGLFRNFNFVDENQSHVIQLSWVVEKWEDKLKVNVPGMCFGALMRKESRCARCMGFPRVLICVFQEFSLAFWIHT